MNFVPLSNPPLKKEQENLPECVKRLKKIEAEKEESSKQSSRNNDSTFKNEAVIQSSAPQRAFSNALIVRKILSYVSPSTALNLRLLSKTFEAEATSFLLSDKRTNQKLQVKFTWESPRSSLDDEQGSYEHVYMGSLSEFVDNCWSTSRRFPVRNFYFDNCCLSTKDILDFFSKVGNQIEGLTLSMLPQDSDPQLMPPLTRSFNPHTIKAFAQILYELTPNLKHLNLVSTTWSPELSLLKNTKLEPEKRVLSSLQTLTLQGQGSYFSSGVVRDILNSAPNLQLVCDPQLKFTEVLVACQKLHLTPKSLKWVFGQNRQTNGKFYSYAEIRPSHFQKIELGFGKSGFVLDTSPEMGRALSNILQGSGESLKKIDQLPFLQCIENVQPLPVLKKVKLLRFYQYTRIMNPGPSGMLPSGDTLQEVFPNLKTLGLYQLHESEDLNPLFQQFDEHRHDGVTTLELHSKFDTFVQDPWIHRSALLYPNITTLEVRIMELGVLPDICRAIWTDFDRIENLSLYLDTWKNNLGDKLPGEIDSAMTGIPLESCKQLRRNLKLRRSNNAEVKDIEGNCGDRLRSKLSILNLLRLKTFKIDSQCLENYEDVFTSVSTQFAFIPMFERQKVEITFKFSPLKRQAKLIVINEHFVSQHA